MCQQSTGTFRRGRRICVSLPATAFVYNCRSAAGGTVFGRQESATRAPESDQQPGGQGDSCEHDRVIARLQEAQRLRNRDSAVVVISGDARSVRAEYVLGQMHTSEHMAEQAQRHGS